MVSSLSTCCVVTDDNAVSYEQWLLDQPCIVTGSTGFNTLISINYSSHDYPCYQLPMTAFIADLFNSQGALSVINQYYCHETSYSTESAKCWFQQQAQRLYNCYVSMY